MRKIHLSLVWACLALLWAGSSTADNVADLHAASVPVAEQSDKALAAAARVALSEVLVKVSGSAELLRNPSIASALADARSHVQQYAYVRGTPPAAPLAVRFEFEPAYITELVVQAGAPLWTANRPLVLAWVVVEDEQGKHFISWDSSPEQAQQLLDEFSRRGVPVQLPVFDLIDMTALSLDDAWQLNAAAIQAASARYNVQDVVAGHLARLNTGQASGDWTYFNQDNRLNRSLSAPDLQAFLRDGVNLVAADMASRYAVAPTGGQEGGLRMSVTGVSSYADYAGIVGWLENLELVESANIERIQGDRIELRLQARADAAQLAGTIQLNQHLLPLAAQDPGIPLNFQWQN
ncbi:MAG: DUF2066 domain-containing protein [Halioglobus sp.]